MRSPRSRPAARGFRRGGPGQSNPRRWPISRPPRSTAGPLSRAPLQGRVARPRKAGLTAQARGAAGSLVLPYVMEEFRFHLTLTGQLPRAEAESDPRHPRRPSRASPAQRQLRDRQPLLVGEERTGGSTSSIATPFRCKVPSAPPQRRGRAGRNFDLAHPRPPGKATQKEPGQDERSNLGSAPPAPARTRRSARKPRAASG